MDERSLRRLVREEVDAALDDVEHVDSHPKFRRMVEQKLGRRFTGTDDGWTVTYEAWAEALKESSGVDMEVDVLEFYASEAVRVLRG